MFKKYSLYILFALLSVFINNGAQILTKITLGNFEIFHNSLFSIDKLTYLLIVQLCMGTGFGFLAKFILDKFIVFQENHKNMAHTIRQFFIYGSLALITTAIFWGFALTFKFVFDYKYAEFIGGNIGLAIGYTVKFFLDKKFVFQEVTA